MPINETYIMQKHGFRCGLLWVFFFFLIGKHDFFKHLHIYAVREKF